MRTVRLFHTLSTLALAACGATPTPGQGAASLESQESFLIPLGEVSGLTLRGAQEVLAIGDCSRTIAITDLGTRASRTVDVARVMGASGPSNWEAIATDSIGRVYILEEAPGRIFVLSPQMDRLIHTFSLTVSGPAEDSWEEEKNSRGEGFVLLPNGHFLVVKEKKPMYLIEFGPAGEEASGYSVDSLSSGGAAFAKVDYSSESSELVPLKTWPIEGGIDDISEITVGLDARLYGLSDDSNVVFRFEDELSSNEDKVERKDTTDLPDSIENAEGLIVSSADSILVAVDSSGEGDCSPPAENNVLLLEDW